MNIKNKRKFFFTLSLLLIIVTTISTVSAIDVKNTNTALEASSNTTGVNQPITFKANLTVVDSNEPLANQTIQFLISNGSVVEDFNTTGPDGIASLVFTPTEIGNYSIMAVFVGKINDNDFYAPSVSEQIKVEVKDSVIININTTTDVAKAGDRVNVTITVTNQNGTVIMGENVTITINGVDYSRLIPRTGANAGKIVINNVLMTTSDMIINAVFDNPVYALANETKVVTFRKEATNIEVTVNTTESLRKGDRVTITVNLTGEEKGVRGNVTIYINGEPVRNGTTNNNGIFTYVYTMDTENIDIYAVFEENDQYLGSESNNLTVNFRKENTTLTVDTNASEAKKGDRITITVNLQGEDKGARGNVTIYINGEPVRNGTTNNNGIFTYVYTMGTDSLEIYAVFEGNDQYIGSESNKINVNFRKENTTLTINTISQAEYDEVFDVVINLTNEAGKGFADNITVQIGDTTYNVRTNAQGIATIKNVKMNTTENLTIIATYPGNEQYEASIANTTVEFLKSNLTLIAQDMTFTVGDIINLTASLTGSLGNLTDKKISFKIWKDIIAELFTNASGVAMGVYDTTDIPAGTYTCFIEFAGDSYFNACNISVQITLLPEELETLNTLFASLEA